MSILSTATPPLPDATSAGADHAAPRGVQPATPATDLSARRPPRSQSTEARTATTGASETSVMSAISVVISRARRVASSSEASELDTRAPSTQVAMITIAEILASITERGSRAQVTTCAIAIAVMERAGSPTRPASARAGTSRLVGRPKSAKERGSRVWSTPKARGTTRNPSTITDPTVTVMLPASSGSTRRSEARPATVTPVAPRA